MALDRELWLKVIQDSLFANNEHLNFAMDDSGDIFTDGRGHKTVHIPQSGTKPAIAINRGVVPATITQRTDTDLDYAVDEYTTDPILLREKDDNAYLSYDKRRSVMSQHIATLREHLGRQTFFRWAEDLLTATDNLITTTGADLTSALAPGATGTRKAITLDDLSALAGKMDLMEIPDDGNRYLSLPSDMYRQMLAANPNISRADEFGSATLPSGVVNRVMGFNIMKRSSVNVYDVAEAIKAVGAASAATDNLAGFAWHSDFVSKADGGAEVMQDFGDGGNGKPEYYGGLLSAIVYFGAHKRREDNAGIISLVQGQ